MKKIIIIDGNSLLFRAYYATSFTGTIMKRKDGFPTNAIFGFHNMIMKLLSSIKEGDLFFVAFDTGKKTFRHQEMETYKAQRKEVEEDLIVQLPVARELLDAMGVFHFEIDGYEGDDVAGTVAKIAEKEGLEVQMYTSDKDYLQLITDKISIHMIKKGFSDIRIMTRDTLFEDMGLEPDQIRDYKGLMGDPSDNIKGIPGVGEKTALKLIQEHHSLENIIEAMKDQKSKLAEKIIANQDLGRFCKYIATIDVNVPIPFKLDELEYLGYEFHKLSSFYVKYEFFSLLKKLKPSNKRNKSVETSEKLLTSQTISSFKSITNEIKSFYIVRDDNNYHKAKPINIQFCDGANVYILDYSIAKSDSDLIKYLEDENINKSTFDLKAATVLLSKDNIDLKGVTFDLLLASYLIDSSLDNDPVTVCAAFGENILTSTSELSLFDDGSKWSNLVFSIAKIKNLLLQKLEEQNLTNLFNEIELPLAKILAKMELEGFPLNKDALKVIDEKYNAILNELVQKIYALSGYEFNIASPKQVADLLFNHLNLPSNKKQSTSIEVLNELKHTHPIVPLIIEYRKYAKLISTYTTGLSEYVFEDGKIHALFNQALTTTGRLSSSEPNLQNITVRDEEGKLIRKAFFYEEENVSLLSLDYSQIELRLLAHIANCQTLIDIFNNGRDIHTETARKVFNIPEDQEVPSSLRRKAKMVNFGIVYGISDWGLAEQLMCPVKEAKTMIDTFYDIYPEIKTYFDELLNQAYKKAYVTTLFNRRRYIKELQADNYMTREFGRRAAKNAPIQGTAADIIKLAMIKIDKELTKNNFKSKLVLQIHDELIYKIYEDEKEAVYNLVKECMENVVQLKVKLEVDGSIARTWYDTK